MLKTLVISERARSIAIAIAVAVFAGMLTLFYVSNYKRHVQDEQKTVPVLVAAKNIPPGTLGTDVLADELATVRNLPRASIAPGSFASAQQLETLVAADQIYAGEQVTARRFRPRAERGVRSKLEGNLRAIEVPGSPNQVLAGTLREGDRVDVVANFQVESTRGQGDLHFTRTVLRDILVLRGAAAADGGGVGADDKVAVQLALTDAQAQKLYFAMENGSNETGTGWWLTVRPVSKSADSPESIETFWTILRDGLKVSQIRRAYGAGVRP